MGSTIAASLYYLAIALMLVLLTCEHGLLKAQIDRPRARGLMRIDLAYNVAASLMMSSGLAYLIGSDSGLDHYLYNLPLYATVGLLLIVSTLSLLPTVTFFNWRNEVLAGHEPRLASLRYRQVIWAIRAEFILLAGMAMLAARIG